MPPPPPQVSSRAVWQLALAMVLADDLLPGLDAPPLISDPGLTNFDRRVIAALGLRVAGSGGDGAALCVADEPTFVYAPNCPVSSSAAGRWAVEG